MKRPRLDWLVLVLALFIAGGCGGGGCGGCTTFQPIPGGFPAAKRTPNAVQVRVTQTGLAAVAANPAALIGSIAGGAGGVLKFNAPANCGGSTPICCPNNTPQATCGPIDIDLNARPGDLPRLVLRPAQGASRLDVTVRARVRTERDIPVKVAGINCAIRIDTAGGTPDDLQVDAQISFVQDATSGTTKVTVGTVALPNLSTDDVSLEGNFLCDVGDAALGLFLGILRDQLTAAIRTAIQAQTCKACPSGSVGECGTFATACTGGVCRQGAECMQELGLVGRLSGGALLGALSPGTTGAIDIYEVAGGYALSDNNGLSLGLRGGMQPGGSPRDRCGPQTADPAPVTIARSTFFEGNTRPDTSAAFDIGIGVHASQLGELASAGYNGGLFCLTIGRSAFAQLSTDTLSLLSRSLTSLVESNSAMAIGLRPQRPPVITLGKNVFTDDGAGNRTLSEPLLDIRFAGMEIDFFVSVDDQFIRAFTAVSDVHLPIGLQVTGMGELAPVIGSTTDAFSNVSIKNNDAVTEAPADMAALFPNLLGLVLPQLSSGFGAIALPSLGGLDLAITDVTAVDNSSFLAIFANLSTTPAAAAPVETRIALGEISEPAAAIARDPKLWKGARGPRVQLELGGDADDLEWSHRLDDGLWSAWSTNPRPTLASDVLWLPGSHKIDVRARRIGRPETIDPTPASVDVVLGAGVLASRPPPVRPFHGQASEAGCNCDSSGSAGAALPLALLLIALVVPVRMLRRVLRGGRRRRLVGPGRRTNRRSRLGLAAIAVVALASLLPGCSCSGGASCGGGACLDGEVAHGLGRWTSIAADADRVVVATYDTRLGDLVAVDARDPASLALVPVDGVPDATPKYDPSTYRGGIDDPGPDVGAWTSVALAGGLARIAYQDRDAGALAFALETSRGAWSHHIVDPSDGAEVGRYASLAIDGAGNPAIAYLALGTDDGSGVRITELRLARAKSAQPGAGDWTSHVIASAPGSCAGLCGGGEACVAAAGAQRCVAPTTDCTAACAAGTVCSAGACVAELPAPDISAPATGTGLFVSLVVLPDQRLAAAYYDQVARALKLAVETEPGASAFTEAVLDAGAGRDTGLWASAVVDAGGTVHVAYQDAISDQLMYTTWNATPGTPEIVDDGQRTGDRTHAVGAGAAIYLVGGAPAIAYQDGTTADVHVATRSAAAWTSAPFAVGPALDGFSVAATTGAGVPLLAWGRIDPRAAPVHQLAVESP